ncbi:hypothetical protein JVU11DRAFT_10404 [Chiua virens]|nr:hypothetical protein JVU11DRAFT_10404 [Chiua virens]
MTRWTLTMITHGTQTLIHWAPQTLLKRTQETLKSFQAHPQSYPHGNTSWTSFFLTNTELRKENLYYLFASQQDWQLASWLLRSRLSIAVIDSFLSLQLVSALTDVITRN